MKIGRLASLAVLNLLNNLLHAWHLLAVLEKNFNSILRSIRLFTFRYDNMDEDGQEQDRNLGHALPQALVRFMGEDNDDDDEEEERIEADDDEDLDDDSPSDVEFSSDDEVGISMSESEDDDDIDMDRDIDLYDMNDYSAFVRDIWGIRSPTPTLYTFKPLRLVRCNYKPHNPHKEYPLARSGHRIIACESNLYSLGGYNPHNTQAAAMNGDSMLFQELWRYNFATRHWKQVLDPSNSRNMPSELASNALVIHNNLLISYGGTGFPFGESCSNDCYVYLIGDKPSVVRLEATGDRPIPQYGAGIVVHEHYLYTIGGTTGFDYSCDVYRLDLKTKVWECMYICRPDARNDPEGRYRHEVVYDTQHIYVLGGGTSHSVYDLQRIPAFNLKTNCWDYFDTLPDRSVDVTTSTAQDVGFPKPRKCFSCVQHTNWNGDIEAFITGGLQRDLVYFADIWKLNLRTKQWTWIRTASLPKPLYFHAAAQSSNGCMYIFGGIEYDDKNSRRCNDLYKMWMGIPKLSEMCWDAVTHYNKNLNTYSRSKLLHVGIPVRFVQRLQSR